MKLTIKFGAQTTNVNGHDIGNANDSSRYERVQIGDAIKALLFERGGTANKGVKTG